jgi:integrase
MISPIPQHHWAQSAVGSDEWSWPVDLTRYQHSPFFCEPELQELDQIMPWCALPRVLPFALEQLLAPVQEALEASHAHPRMRLDAKRVLLVEMHKRRSPFWNWAPEEWSETLCSTAVAFTERYPGAVMCRQQVLTAAYLLCGFTAFHQLGGFLRKRLADTTFGAQRMEATIQRVVEGTRRWGLTKQHDLALHSAVREALLVNRSPHPEDLTYDLLFMMGERTDTLALKRALRTFSCALLALGLFTNTLPEVPYPSTSKVAHPHTFLIEGTDTVAPEWLQYCQRWHATSTLTYATRQQHYSFLLKTGRWLTQEHPEYLRPRDWTREFVATCVAFVDQQRIGDWIEPGNVKKLVKDKVGQPVGPGYKKHFLAALRAFFLDCQEWGWFPPRFDPRRALGTPRSIRMLIGPNPRVISDGIWAKLLWAGFNLTQDDISSWTGPLYKDREKHRVAYPLEMVRAMTTVWLFCGIRSDEWSRLRVGCVRWQREDVLIPGTDEILPRDVVCMLDIPTHKTGTAFTKPVDRVVGEAIEVWERVRPTQPPKIDPKTGEEVHFLFCYRGYRVGKHYINKVLIPTLCTKGGVPRQDARGNITSHRARSTIATQLFNAAEPMSLFELQEWLGHRYIGSTQHYAKISPTRLAKSKAKAEYFERNLRLIDILLEQDAIKSGAAADGQPWRYYDLGHGLCTYDFFDACPHRMACAKCSFYVPKGSSLEQVIEGKANLLRLKQELSLTEEEVAAVDDGLAALATLQQKLVDVPTPAGPTPRQLEESLQQTGFISVQTVHRKPSMERI